MSAHKKHLTRRRVRLGFGHSHSALTALDALSHHRFVPGKQPHLRFQRPFQCVEDGRTSVQRAEASERRTSFDCLDLLA